MQAPRPARGIFSFSWNHFLPDISRCRRLSRGYASATSGTICLQSKGSEIHFRNITLTPLPQAQSRGFALRHCAASKFRRAPAK